MAKTIFLFLLMFISIFSSAQHGAMEFAIVQGTQSEIISTGKRHNSCFFVLNIDKVLQGDVNDSVVISQEILMDFGGKQTIRKLEQGLVIIKYFYNEVSDEMPEENRFIPERLRKLRRVRLVWVAHPERRQTMETLEQILRSTFSEEFINMLPEENGKLFIRTDDGLKLATEGEGTWKISDVK